uniref:Uncharacterized protein n=1 Tax=Glossina austeni TaxID=7395 RepID=A0A1A9VTT8_GLOAU
MDPKLNCLSTDRPKYSILKQRNVVFSFLSWYPLKRKLNFLTRQKRHMPRQNSIDSQVTAQGINKGVNKELTVIKSFETESTISCPLLIHLKCVVSRGHESRNQQESLKTLNMSTNMIQGASEIIENRSQASNMKVMK